MIVAQLITSFISSAAFGIIFNIPKDTLIKCGIVGMAGWFVHNELLNIPVDPVLATLASAFFVTLTSHFLAKIYKKPVTVFSVSGIIPLLPGGTAYDAMRNVVENHYDLAVPLAAKAFMLSGAIAIGLVFSEVINQVIIKLRQTRQHGKGT